MKLGQGIESEARVYNPKLKKGLPNLTAEVRLYRDGELVTEAAPVPVEVKAPLKRSKLTCR